MNQQLLNKLLDQVIEENDGGDTLLMLERMAELVTLECVAICDKVEADSEMDLSDGALVCAAEIKEKFGIK